MTRLPLLLAAAIICLLAPRFAHAQGGDSGAITGYVFDQTGMPLPGIKITATSSTQIGGAKVAYSDAEGSFRLRPLIPGTFEVRAAGPNMKALVQKDIKVGITSAVELNLVMEVKTAQEEITVVQKAPTVSTTKPNISQQFESEFIEALPHASRDNVHRDMLGSVPGAVSNRMRGGAANQTVVTQDGFELGPPGKTISPSLKSSAAFEIQSGGYGADNPTASGGLLNLVTRSGSNKFEAEFNATMENNQLQFFRDQRDPRSDTFYYVINPMFAGPIIKDKLWYFFNTETHFTQDGRQRDIEGVLPDPLPVQRIIQKGSIKLTWQASGRNKVSLINNYELPFERNRVANLGTAPEAQEDRTTRRIFLGAIWESVLTDDIILKTQAGATWIPEHIFPSRCRNEKDTCDFIPSVIQTYPRSQRFDNNNNHSFSDVRGLQFVNQIEWFAGKLFLGEHNFQLKDRFYTEQQSI
ncbi:MAG TPA: carboxypeptidase regulatory-like domain-containing protein, partial [Polyangia bacterium]